MAWYCATQGQLCENTVLFALKIDHSCTNRYPYALDMRNIYQRVRSYSMSRYFGPDRLQLDLGSLAHGIQAQARHNTQLKLPLK